jgi:hypothetical protein
MKPEAQRIAIAKACGISEIKADWWGWDFRGVEMPGDMPFHVKVPDYLNSLDAMAEARDELINTTELRIKWVNKLRDVVGQTTARRNKLGQPIVSDIDLLLATSPQLQEALLKTLLLWEEVAV